MAIDIRKRKPRLKNRFGGLSGPAIKPVAVRMVYQVSKAVKIPVIGIGGISNWEDAVPCRGKCRSGWNGQLLQPKGRRGDS